MHIKVLCWFICIASLSFSQSVDTLDIQLKSVQELINTEDFAQGLSILNILSQKYPHNNNVQRSYAILFLKLKNYDSALTHIQQAISLAQTNGLNYIVAGNIYRAKKDFENAKNAYEKAIQLVPELAIAYYEYAILNLEHYYIQEANRLLHLSLNFDQNAWYNMLLEAQIAKYKNQYTEAQSIFFKIIDQFPYEEMLLDEFAQFYLFYKKPEKAIVLLKEANKRFGENSQRTEILGDILFRQKKYPEALQYYQKSDTSSHEFPYANAALLKWKLYNLYLELNDSTNSSINIKKAFELDPKNQLYISALYTQLKKQDIDDPTRQALSSYLEKIAVKERTKGVGNYYLSLLQKIIGLTPKNLFARKGLIDYAKINDNEYIINKILHSIQQYYPNDITNNRSIDLRNHLEKTIHFDQNSFPIYHYTNLVFIENDSNYFGEHIKNEIQNIEVFFPNISSYVELKKSFKDESRYLFNNNTNYNLVTHIAIDNVASALDITLYDKTGLPIDFIKHYYTPELLIENLTTYVERISELLPPIGFIISRLPDSMFKISLGSRNDLSTNSILAVLDQFFIPITTFSVQHVEEKTAIVKQIDIPLQPIDIKTAFVVPVMYIPELIPPLKTKNKKDTSTVTNAKVLLKQVSQIRHSVIENLDNPE